MHLCCKNVVVVGCILLEMHYVVIIVVIIIRTEKRVGRGHRVCKNNKSHKPKNVEKHCIRNRRYGPPLKAAFAKWPPGQINCSPLD